MFQNFPAFSEIFEKKGSEGSSKRVAHLILTHLNSIEPFEAFDEFALNCSNDHQHTPLKRIASIDEQWKADRH